METKRKDQAELGLTKEDAERLRIRMPLTQEQQADLLGHLGISIADRRARPAIHVIEIAREKFRIVRGMPFQPTRREFVGAARRLEALAEGVEFAAISSSGSLGELRLLEASSTFVELEFLDRKELSASIDTLACQDEAAAKVCADVMDALWLFGSEASSRHEIAEAGLKGLAGLVRETSARLREAPSEPGPRPELTLFYLASALAELWEGGGRNLCPVNWCETATHDERFPFAAFVRAVAKATGWVGGPTAGRRMIMLGARSHVERRAAS